MVVSLTPDENPTEDIMGAREDEDHVRSHRFPHTTGHAPMRQSCIVPPDSHHFRMKWLPHGIDILQSQLKQKVESLHKKGVALRSSTCVNTEQNQTTCVLLLAVENGIAWLDPHFFPPRPPWYDDTSVQ